MREKATDALLSAAIKSIEELEAIVVMIGTVNKSAPEVALSSKLREIAGMLDQLSLLESDLNVIKKRLRGMLSTDPDKTPRAISVKDLQAVTPETETKFVSVEDPPGRRPTYRGLGISLPKKDE
jgi:hypothetical protein